MAITINDNVQVNSPKSADNKYLKSGLFVYASVAEVNSTILQAYRSQGLTVLVNVGGVPTEYWYHLGTSDGQLIVKSPDGTGGKDAFTLATAGTRSVSGDLLLIRLKPTSSLTGFKVGTALNGEDIVPTSAVSSGAWTTITLGLFYESPTTLYFGGITSSTDIVVITI